MLMIFTLLLLLNGHMSKARHEMLNKKVGHKGVILIKKDHV